MQIWQDEIVEEIHQVRDAYAARFNYDIAAMVEDAQERQHQSGRELVTLSPTRPEPSYVIASLYPEAEQARQKQDKLREQPLEAQNSKNFGRLD